MVPLDAVDILARGRLKPNIISYSVLLITFSLYISFAYESWYLNQMVKHKLLRALPNHYFLAYVITMIIKNYLELISGVKAYLSKKILPDFGQPP